MSQTYTIYLDVCCLNRPLDDSSQDRIRLEAEAVLLIYRKCRLGEWNLVSSGAIEAEVKRTPNRRSSGCDADNRRSPFENCNTVSTLTTDSHPKSSALVIIN